MNKLNILLLSLVLAAGVAVVSLLVNHTSVAHAQSGAGSSDYHGEDLEDADETRVAPLQSREVIEHLKMLRAQILLEEEYNRLLEVRLERLEIEAKIAAVDTTQARRTADRRPLPSAPTRRVPSPASLESASERDLVVKSVTTVPFKEAFVVYQGRTYTVRPGDQLGDIRIIDINQSGVVTNRRPVLLER